VVVSRVQGGRTPLHVATDWPGYFPDGPAVVALLIAAGADPNVAVALSGPGETPLLLARGADIDATPGHARGQTPLSIAGSRDTRREGLVTSLGEHGASAGAG
jgi:uncharacterized protein